MKKSTVIHAFLKAAGLCVLLMVGCGGGGGGPQDTGNAAAKISDWKQRELNAPTIETECVVTGDIQDDITHIISYVSAGFEPRNEEEDYWKTSQQALEDGFGDCEDMAAIAYRALSDSCLVEAYGLDVRMRIVAQGNTEHAIAIAYTDDAFFEIDNFVVIDHESEYPVNYEFYVF